MAGVTEPDTEVDLVVIGFGPTGATLAGLTARRGLRVVIVERDTEIFSLPRAVQCDHEVLRILQELGCADEVVAGSIRNDGLSFLSADRQVLLSATVPAMAATGWPTSVFFHQPSFEETLRRTVRNLGAHVLLGHEVTSIGQDDNGVTVSMDNAEPVRARFAIGCDGARSMTRKIIGTDLRDSGFEEPWLVIDLFLDSDVPGLPTRCLQVCDPTRPHTLVPMPGRRFRFEFMLLPGESANDIQQPAAIERLLGTWIDPTLVTIERAAVYTFHGLVATRWRDRRVFLAGDAAHQTPPFLGQGMCAGMRDAANLAWKLAAATAGSPDALLNTYQLEREPHAQAVIDVAVGFGQLICMLDPTAAAERDARMLADRPAVAGASDGAAPNMIPPLNPGPAVGPRGGDLSRQPLLGGERLDDLIGTGFALCTAEPLDPHSATAAWWQEHGVVLDASTHPELRPLLDGEPACAIRPDRYVLARGDIETVTALANDVLGPNDRSKSATTKVRPPTRSPCDRDPEGRPPVRRNPVHLRTNLY